MTKGTNVFTAHKTNKTTPRIILVSGNEELRNKFSGLTVADIGELLGVDPDSGVAFANKVMNDSTIHNLILTGNDGIAYVFPLSSTISADIEAGNQINPATLLDWECRKITVPLFERNADGELVRVEGQTRESMNIGMPSGVLTFDNVNTFNAWETQDNTEATVGATTATNTVQNPRVAPRK